MKIHGYFLIDSLAILVWIGQAISDAMVLHSTREWIWIQIRAFVRYMQAHFRCQFTYWLSKREDSDRIIWVLQVWIFFFFEKKVLRLCAAVKVQKNIIFFIGWLENWCEGKPSCWRNTSTTITEPWQSKSTYNTTTLKMRHRERKFIWMKHSIIIELKQTFSEGNKLNMLGVSLLSSGSKGVRDIK